MMNHSTNFVPSCNIVSSNQHPDITNPDSDTSLQVIMECKCFLEVIWGFELVISEGRSASEPQHVWTCD